MYGLVVVAHIGDGAGTVVVETLVAVEEGWSIVSGIVGMTLVPAVVVVVVVVLEGGKTLEWAIPFHSWLPDLETPYRFSLQALGKQHILSWERLVERRKTGPAAVVAGDTGSSAQGCAAVVAVGRMCPAWPCGLLRMESLRLRGVRDNQP